MTLLLVVISIGVYFFIYRDWGTSPEKNYNQYCGSCHLTPDPANIPKSIWRNRILPEMAARMGYRYNNNDPFKFSMEENYYIKLSNAFPEESLIDSIQWKQIHDYVINLAPDSISNSPSRIGRNSDLSQFESSLRTLDSLKTTGGIVSINFDASSNKFLIGDINGKLHDGENPIPIRKASSSPIVSSFVDDSTLYLTEVGILNPSELSRGKIYSIKDKQITSIFNNLHRPVYTEVNDLNNDGNKEIIICEFGHHSGQLSMLIKRDSVFEKRTLLGFPGSIKVEITDMNGDGKKDIVALFSQGREGIYVFYQKDDLMFDVKQIIKMGPEYGSSWFSLFDYDDDEDLDIVLVNGDNADNSNFLKPYHGIRLFINDGGNDFTEEWFYPINGATRVMVEDFDLDGDHDFAVLSFFPDFENCPEEGFVYLENLDSESYNFKPYITQEAKKGNWLVMEKGDFDRDGDVDIMLGNFSLLTTSKLKGANQYDVLYLENMALKEK